MHFTNRLSFFPVLDRFGLCVVDRVGGGREEYYLSQVASGVEDYYLGSGEAAGVWMGAGVGALGLGGEVDGDDLRAVLAGVAPSGGALARPGRRTPGFDLTFSAPKSVSILNALGDATVAAAVLAGHDEAVRQAMGYLERHACFTRRGAGGTNVIGGEGFLAAAFRHRTSRAGDPQLHTHVLVPNLVRGVDGRWSALDGRFLYAHLKTAGRAPACRSRRTSRRHPRLVQFQVTDALTQQGPSHGLDRGMT